MEIEKLIEILRGKCAVCKRSSCNGKYWQLSSCPATCEAADALEHLQAENDRLKEEVQQMRWIPVEERLPEKMGEYIVCVDGEVKSDAYCMLEGIERWLCYDGALNALYIDPYSSKPLRQGPYPRVTHWMHLPKAPKEDNL